MLPLKAKMQLWSLLWRGKKPPPLLTQDAFATPLLEGEGLTILDRAIYLYSHHLTLTHCMHCFPRIIKIFTVPDMVR